MKEKELVEIVNDRFEECNSLLSSVVIHKNTLLEGKYELFARYELPISFALAGRVAGYFVPSPQPRIRLNYTLFMQNFDAFLKRTVAHEYAHAIAYRNFWKQGISIRPHGKEWKAIMHQMKVDSSRCHSYKTTPARKQKKFDYTCGCQTFQVGTQVHTKVMNGHKYRCKLCKSNIWPLDQSLFNKMDFFQHYKDQANKNLGSLTRREIK